MLRSRPQESIDDLIRAVEHDDMWTVQELLRSGVNVNGRDRYNITPLFSACARSNLNVVNLLLDARACVKLRDGHDQDALMKSVNRGNLRVIHALISAGADPLTRNRVGETALAIAAETGATSILDTFLWFSDHKRQRALWTAVAFTRAVKAQCQTTLDYLFMKKAWPWSLDNRGENAWEIALKTGQEALARVMIKSYCRDRYFESDVTQSTLAMADQGHVRAVKTLLLVNGSLDVVDEVTGATPLMLAAAAGHY